MVDQWQRHRHLFSHLEGNPAWTPAMFRSLAENVAVGMYLLEDDRFRYVNTRLAQMLGYRRAEILELEIFDVVAHDERQRVAEKLRQTLTDVRHEVHYERKARCKDGSLIDVEIFGSSLLVDGKRIVSGVMLDVTDRKKEESMAQLTSLVYEHSNAAMVVTDANGVVITVNPAFTDITGYALDDVVGRRISVLSSGRHDKAFYASMWNTITTEGSWEGEVWNRRKNGEEYVERLNISTSYNDDGSVRCRVGLFSDVTEKKRRDERIWHQAHYDYLTGLPNRLMLQQSLEAKMLYARHTGSGLALLYLDLDLFKEINDTLGHARGDELLRQVSTRLLGCVRRSDLVARLGGDEFCVVIDGVTEPEKIRTVCEKIVRAVAEPFVLDQDRGLVSVSIGVVRYPQDGETTDELIESADLAMYAAKELGRNGYSLFVPGMRKDASVRRQLARDLSVALHSQQFVLHYQPIIDLRSGRVVKAEALLRWQHPQNGLLGPLHFIEEAEETGLIVEIGHWVFKEAAAQLAQWRSRHPDVQMAVNMSLAQFSSPNLHPADLLAILQRYDLPGNSMVIEITERLLMNVSPEIGNKLLAFSDAGMQISLDDFGTGCSSLPYLQNYNVGYLKIDLSFVRNIERSLKDQRLCEAVILMANKLGIAVIAEGVTTPGQRSLLLEAGCDYVQGFFYSAPVTPEAFGQLLDSPGF
ncbi:MAG TPA: EAL domain-containing protein [Pusillimonas sp.]|uniref:putative bifunctional diguanylate cyclase/phosphodiesterase n=1 Tax=Pusillimonas sp. TaxID=3040095 RepID=UPI002B59F027|nr:EAL domain-containing protein [Pusillimonas sp.]HUH86922.1 EAL domain-containing protein [Pusillimonas sp.]